MTARRTDGSTRPGSSPVEGIDRGPAAEAAKHIDVTERQLRRLRDKGIIKSRPQPRGYDLDEVRQDYLRHLRRKTVTAAGSNRSPPASTDRKSTRLNSSHVRISYAVFCL